MAIISKKYVKAADDPFDDMGFEDEEMEEETPAEGEPEEEMTEEDEEREFFEDFEDDDIDIDTDNNISDHYIAECDHCHGVFISSVMLSDERIESISGVCPLCEHESDQLLKWVIKDVK